MSERCLGSQEREIVKYGKDIKDKNSFFLLFLLLIHLQHNEGRTGGQGHDLEEAQLQINYKAILDQTFDAHMFVKRDNVCEAFKKAFKFELLIQFGTLNSSIRINCRYLC